MDPEREMSGGCGSHFVSVTVVLENFRLCWTQKTLECACLTTMCPIWGALRARGGRGFEDRTFVT